MIAYCGLDCSKCDAYLATIENSDLRRIETAQKWTRSLAGFLMLAPEAGLNLEKLRQ